MSVEQRVVRHVEVDGDGGAVDVLPPAGAAGGGGQTRPIKIWAFVLLVTDICMSTHDDIVAAGQPLCSIDVRASFVAAL